MVVHNALQVYIYIYLLLLCCYHTLTCVVKIATCANSYIDTISSYMYHKFVSSILFEGVNFHCVNSIPVIASDLRSLLGILYNLGKHHTWALAIVGYGAKAKQTSYLGMVYILNKFHILFKLSLGDNIITKVEIILNYTFGIIGSGRYIRLPPCLVAVCSMV